MFNFGQIPTQRLDSKAAGFHPIAASCGAPLGSDSGASCNVNLPYTCSGRFKRRHAAGSSRGPGRLLRYSERADTTASITSILSWPDVGNCLNTAKAKSALRAIGSLLRRRKACQIVVLPDLLRTIFLANSVASSAVQSPRPILNKTAFSLAWASQPRHTLSTSRHLTLIPGSGQYDQQRQ
jgi:hypothetical protein